MSLVFEWDSDKARANLSKHGIGFDEASTVLSDVLSLTIPDPLHSTHEDRHVTLGCSYWQRLLVVVHTERGGRVRIISARQATKKERQEYETHAK